MTCQYLDCENRATQAVGRKDACMLCDSCAAKPEFNRLKIRKPLPKPLSKSLIGKCFILRHYVVMITDVKHESKASAVSINYMENHMCEVRHTLVHAHQLQNEQYAREVSYEQFLYAKRKALEIFEKILHPPDTKGVFN